MRVEHFKFGTFFQFSQHLFSLLIAFSIVLRELFFFSLIFFLFFFSRRAVEICEYDSRREIYAALSYSSRSSSSAEEEVGLTRLATTTTPTNASRCSVEMKHIDRAVKELFASPFTPFMQSACLHEKLCLISCLLETRFRGSQSVPMVQVYERYCNICSSHRIADASKSHEFFRICNGLNNSGLIFIDCVGAGRGIGTEIGIGSSKLARPSASVMVAHNSNSIGVGNSSAGFGSGFQSFLVTSPLIRLIAVPEDVLFAMHDDPTLSKLLPSSSDD